MKRRINSRTIREIFTTMISVLVVIGIGWGTVGLFANARLEPWKPHLPNLVYAARVAKFAWQMDLLYDTLPDKSLDIRDGQSIGEGIAPYWGMMTNSKQIGAIVLEVVPYFEYEFGWSSVYPEAMGFVPLVGVDHFHVGGSASCAQHLFLINWKYVNAYSPRYSDTSLLPYIVHELGHVQGVCVWALGGSGSEMEASNQLAMVEVLAAMCNHGNAYAVKPLIGEMRDLAMDYVRATFMDAGLEDWYTAFAKRVIYNSMEENTRLDKSARFWNSTQDRRMFLDFILRAYGQIPFWWIGEALANGENGYETRVFAYYPSASGTIHLDDLAYFLGHTTEMWVLAR